MIASQGQNNSLLIDIIPLFSLVDFRLLNHSQGPGRNGPPCLLTRSSAISYQLLAYDPYSIIYTCITLLLLT